MTGAFIAVVGASGAGKDALISYARARAGDDAVFPRRTITRPPGPGEDHDPLDPAAFAKAVEQRTFAVTWTAHGLSYGLPASIDTDIESGRVVLANVSRAVLGELARRYSRLVVVRVSVPDDVRAARLAHRGRESGDAVVRRLTRADPAPDHPADVEIVNDGTVEDGGEHLLRIITSVRTRV